MAIVGEQAFGRLTTGGSVDATFGAAGKVFVQVWDPDVDVWALQTGGKVVTARKIRPYEGRRDVVVSRFAPHTG